jgi:hypothetical protein
MSKKLVLCLALLTMGMGVLGCFPAFYGTATIEPGLHCDVGGAVHGAAHVGGTPFMVSPVGIGVRGDFGVKYGLTKFIQVDSRVGLNLVYADPGVGLQLAVPEGPIKPALRVEASCWLTWEGGVFPVLAPALLLGLGDPESFTLGARLHFVPEEPVLPDGFLVFHIPKSKFSIFAGVGFFYVPVVTLGVGYKIK